jgi:hypothetical protein
MSQDSQEDMEEKYIEAIQEYYQLKKQYNDNYKKKKKKIKRRDISLDEKKKLLAKLKMKCIGCKRAVGTIFTNKDGILKAVCGDTASPCAFRIEIKKSDWRYLPSVIPHVKKMVDKTKIQIIETKLNFLFGLEEEQATVALFETLKKDFDAAYSLLVNLEESLAIAENWVERKDMIKAYQIQLYEKNLEFSAAIEEYKQTQNTTLLTDAIKIYIKQILPLEDRIHYNKYADIYIDKEDKYGSIILDQQQPDKYILKTIPAAILQREHEWVEGKVISNLK